MNAPALPPVVAYGAFSRSVHGKVMKGRLPLNATLELSHRCNLDCAHCYNNLPANDASARARELSTDEYLALLDQMADMGTLWLLLTGGEIFARSDFGTLYRHAKDRGFLITLFTNATLVTDAHADALAAAPPFAIEVTLYGATQETYERLTQIPGSYARCLAGIARLQSRGLPLKLKTVGTTLNHHEVAAMRAFAQARGLEFKFDSLLNPRIDCSRSPLEVRLGAKEVVALDLQDEPRIAEWKAFAAQFHGPTAKASSPDAPDLYHCGGGISSYAIDPYGNMSICVLSQAEKFNVRGGKLREAWDGFLFRARQVKASKTTRCTHCHIKAICGNCPANGELEARDREAPVDHLCHVAHLRAEVFDVQVPAHGDCPFCDGPLRKTVRDEAESLRQGAPLVSKPLNLKNIPEKKCGGCGSCSC